MQRPFPHFPRLRWDSRGGRRWSRRGNRANKCIGFFLYFLLAEGKGEESSEQLFRWMSHYSCNSDILNWKLWRNFFLFCFSFTINESCSMKLVNILACLHEIVQSNLSFNKTIKIICVRGRVILIIIQSEILFLEIIVGLKIREFCFRRF